MGSFSDVEAAFSPPHAHGRGPDPTLQIEGPRPHPRHTAWGTPRRCAGFIGNSNGNAAAQTDQVFSSEVESRCTSDFSAPLAQCPVPVYMRHRTGPRVRAAWAAPVDGAFPLQNRAAIGEKIAKPITTKMCRISRANGSWGEAPPEPGGGGGEGCPAPRPTAGGASQQRGPARRCSAVWMGVVCVGGRVSPVRQLRVVRWSHFRYARLLDYAAQRGREASSPMRLMQLRRRVCRAVVRALFLGACALF